MVFLYAVILLWALLKINGIKKSAFFKTDSFKLGLIFSNLKNYLKQQFARSNIVTLRKICSANGGL